MKKPVLFSAVLHIGAQTKFSVNDAVESALGHNISIERNEITL